MCSHQQNLKKERTYMITVVASILSSTIALIGIWLSYFFTKKNMSNEIWRSQKQQSLQASKELPARASRLLDDLYRRNDISKWDALSKDIVAFGSLDAIKIAVAFQEDSYTSEIKKVKTNPLDHFSLIALLTVQLKYDISDVLVSPAMWMKMTFYDYDNKEEDIKASVNRLVDQLELNPLFCIK